MKLDARVLEYYERVMGIVNRKVKVPWRADLMTKW
jgi:hypothetical protein